MKHEQMLDRLVENALDFLERSVADFDDAPKYSVIHFYAAVELFLKARLLAEHWSLVVAKRQDPDLKKFESGDFQSVTLDEAADKLDKVLQSPLTPAEISQFRNLAKHRNRMVHFFHEGATEKAQDDLKRQVAKEQLKAWYFLNRLLLERWDAVFGKWRKELANVTSALKQHNEYLQAVSYTRLEVYKRQVSVRPRCATSGTWSPPRPAKATFFSASLKNWKSSAKRWAVACSISSGKCLRTRASKTC